MMTDGDLLQRYIANHSESAFAELVNRHLTLVYSTALRRVGGDTHLAEGVTQTVFTALARKAETLSDRSALAGWLYLGTHHAAADIIRSQRRKQPREHEAHVMQDLLSSSPLPSDWERVRPVLDDALRELGEADREAVLLRFFQQRPFADIATALHVSENAARMRVDRALDKLHALLGRRGIKSTTAALALVCANQAMVAAPLGMATSVTGAALTGALTASSAFGVNTIFLMSKTTWSLSIIALAAAGFGFREFNERRALQAVNLANKTELAALNSNLRASEERLAAAGQDSATLRREIETLRSQPVPAATASSSSRPAQTGTMVFVESDPMAPNQPAPRGATLTEAFRSVYAPFHRQLGLTPEQAEKFTAIIVATKEHGNELFGAAIASGIKPSEALLREVLKQTEPERDGHLREAFGKATLQAFQRFEAQAPLRSTTSQLASTLFRSGSPLSPYQADQLVAVMAANMPTSGGKVRRLGDEHGGRSRTSQGHSPSRTNTPVPTCPGERPGSSKNSS